MNRRDFLEASGAVLAVSPAAALLPGPAAAQTQAHNPAAGSGSSRSFPPGFIWGSATASYQVEGAVHEGGRGQTIWDTFSHTAGKIANGDTADVADDFYHRFGEDIKLMQHLGIKGFRFSVAWSRIFPSGAGQPNQAGIDFYNRLVDGLLAAGIQPFCTLFHWDLPQALGDKGGWQNRDTAKAFADYAGYTAGFLSDRVRRFMTMNEIRSFVELGYQQGTHAPGLKLNRKDIAQLNHFVVLAHGLSVGAIRAHANPGTEVGIADNAHAVVPVIEIPEHVTAARRALREENASYLTVIQEGRYTDLYLKQLGVDAPVFTPDEMKTIAAPLDFVGLNVYQPTYVRAESAEAGYVVVDDPSSFPHMSSPWLKVGPEALYWLPRLVSDVWGVKTMYITENGASAADSISPDGHVYDTDRTMFLHNYLGQLERAVREGVPVRGYFLWSLLDNYEWADGYGKRFGIVYVDFATEKRTPKLSAQLYREVIATNSVR